MMLIWMVANLLFLVGDTECRESHIITQCDQNVICLGDTLYIRIGVENNGTDPCYVSDAVDPTTGGVQLTLSDKDGNSTPILIECQSDILYSAPTLFVAIPPGETHVTNDISLTIPALEDFHYPFWEEKLKNLSADGSEFTLRIFVKIPMTSNAFLPEGENTIFSGRYMAKNGYEVLECVSEHKITIMPRPENEMNMIRQWYEKTPSDFFPVPDERNPVRKIPTTGHDILTGCHPDSQFLFGRLGNRYPGVPNCPETWQGWKELEESIEPSTMRDEIRMTRMLIQYCETEDPEVLNELTSWLNEMNEIQRSVMIRNVQKLRDNFGQNTEILPTFDRFVEPMRPFDTP